MACTDCFNGCGDELTSDECVKYTGPDIEALDICTGDSLKVVEGKITDFLLSIQTSEGITIADLTGCNSITSLFDVDSSLKSIIQALVTSFCSIKTSVTSIQSTINTTSPSFNIGCLTSLNSSSTRDQIIQAIITKLCSLDSSVTSVLTDYVKASDLNTLIATYITSVAGDNNNVTNYYTSSIPYVALEYYGSLSNFDSTGKGIASLGWDKMYICNGQNGTPDKRGRTAVGAIVGVPGGSLDAAVDPSLPANVGKNYALNDKFGASSILLTTNQLPAHNHPITDPGHKHKFLPDAGEGQVHRSGDTGHALRTENYGASASTTTDKTGITIGNTGASQAHDNVQPSIAAHYIMFIP